MLGCAVVALLGVPIVLLGLTFAGLGHCAPAPDGSGCENEALEKFLWFPGSLIAIVVVGIAVVRFLSKGEK